MLKTGLSTLSVAALAAAGALAQKTADPLSDADVIPLDQWGSEKVYTGGISAEEFIDEMEVYSTTGDDIGDVEDIIIGPEGNVVAVVAEIGGVWDIGDTHVSVPFDEVEMNADGNGIVVPLTEETVGDYDVMVTEAMVARDLDSEVTAGVDDVALGRAWRATELIGDYARLTGDSDFLNYGYVNDIILRDGAVAAVVIERAYDRGGGYEVYPYATADDWDAGTPYYDLPYGETDVEGMEPFDYERLGD